MKWRWVGGLVTAWLLAGLAWLCWQPATGVGPVCELALGLPPQKNVPLYEGIHRSPTTIEARPERFEAQIDRLGWWPVRPSVLERWDGPEPPRLPSRFGSRVLEPGLTNRLGLTLQGQDWPAELPLRGELACVRTESAVVQWLRAVANRVPLLRRRGTAPGVFLVPLPEARPPQRTAAAASPPAPSPGPTPPQAEPDTGRRKA